MKEILKGVWPLFLAIGFLMTGNGLQGTLLGLRAASEGFDEITIGLVMSAYSGGFLLSSVLAPKLIRNVGHIRVFAAFASIASTTVLLHAVFPIAWVWLGLRFVTGVAMAGLYVVAESWLNDAATNKTRGKVLSLYMVTMYACMALGQSILFISSPDSFLPFIIISIFVSMALVPISLKDLPTPKITIHKPISLKKLMRSSPLGFFTSLAVGMSQGALFGMGAVFCAKIGMSVVQTGTIMAAALISVVPVQFVIGWISDRLDRRWVITGSALIVTAISAFASISGRTGFGDMVIIFGLFGAFSLPIYSLAIAHTNDYLEVDEMLTASAKLVFVNGFGAVIGPILVGALMVYISVNAFFAFGAVIHLALAVYALWRMTQRAAVSEDDRGEFVHLAVRATPVAAVTAIEESEERSS
ncbi:MAG: MFS transporter [Rhizobiales bacterium]|nr:MFS transporter [Hyphomicrobiales bacterium]